MPVCILVSTTQWEHALIWAMRFDERNIFKVPFSIFRHPYKDGGHVCPVIPNTPPLHTNSMQRAGVAQRPVYHPFNTDVFRTCNQENSTREHIRKRTPKDAAVQCPHNAPVPIPPMPITKNTSGPFAPNTHTTQRTSACCGCRLHWLQTQAHSLPRRPPCILIRSARASKCPSCIAQHRVAVHCSTCSTMMQDGVEIQNQTLLISNNGARHSEMIEVRDRLCLRYTQVT